MLQRRLSTAVLLLLVGACGGSTDQGVPPDATDEGALAVAGARVHARNVENPSGIAITNEHVYFSANRFIASGEPELDQQFAYWEGEYRRIPLAGGRAEKISDAGLTRIRQHGSKLFVATGSSCWISVIDTAAARPSQKGVYTDPDCTGEGGGEPSGFEVTDSKLVVVREGGEVMVGDHDGSGMRKIAELRFGNYAGFVRATALANDRLYVLTAKGYQSNNRPLPQTIFGVALRGGAIEKVVELAETEPAAEGLVSDGRNVVYSQGKKVFALVSGAGAPRELSDDFNTVGDIASNGTHVFVADAKRDALYVIKNAFTTPRTEKIGDVKGITSIAVGGDRLYYGAHVIANRRVAGTIASIPIE